MDATQTRTWRDAATAQLALTWTLWRRSLGLVLAAAPRQAFVLGLVMLAQAVVPVGTLWASRGIVNGAARAFGVAGAGAGGLSLATWIGVAVGLIVAQQGLAPLFRTTQESVADRLTTYVNGELIGAVNRWQGLARFEDPAFADHLKTTRDRAVRGPVDLAAYGGRLVQALFTIVAMCAALWRLHPLAPVLLLIAHIPAALQENDFAQKSGNIPRLQGADGRKLTACHAAVLSADTAKDVRLYELGGFFSGLYGTLFGRMSAEMWVLRRKLLATMAPAQALSAAAAAAVYLYAIQRVLDGGLTLGDLVLFAGALSQLHLALYEVGFDVGFFAMIFTWLPSLFAVLDAGPDLALPAKPLPAPRPVREGIVLDHVSFRYPGAPTDVLRDISFAIRPGERVALVGRNGAGKTTLVKLLAPLYDPTEGTITLDGVPLARYDLAGLRARTAALFQDFAHFALSARHNVGVGDVAYVDDQQRVLSAARWAGADGVIARLPHGLDTPLTKAFEGGVDLSGGEWQKVAMARAAMRDAALVILDAPTAALDAQAEAELFARFRQLAAGRTVLLISHRFSTVRMADRILVLEDGRIIEQGSHAELVAKGGRYAGLYELQAGRYR